MLLFDFYDVLRNLLEYRFARDCLDRLLKRFLILILNLILEIDQYNNCRETFLKQKTGKHAESY